MRIFGFGGRLTCLLRCILGLSIFFNLWHYSTLVEVEFDFVAPAEKRYRQVTLVAAGFLILQNGFDLVGWQAHLFHLQGLFLFQANFSYLFKVILTFSLILFDQLMKLMFFVANAHTSRRLWLVDRPWALILRFTGVSQIGRFLLLFRFVRYQFSMGYLPFTSKAREHTSRVARVLLDDISHWFFALKPADAPFTEIFAATRSWNWIFLYCTSFSFTSKSSRITPLLPRHPKFWLSWARASKWTIVRFTSHLQCLHCVHLIRVLIRIIITIVLEVHLLDSLARCLYVITTSYRDGRLFGGLLLSFGLQLLVIIFIYLIHDLE